MAKTSKSEAAEGAVQDKDRHWLERSVEIIFRYLMVWPAKAIWNGLSSRVIRYLCVSSVVVIGWLYLFQRTDWFISAGIGSSLLGLAGGLFGFFSKHSGDAGDGIAIANQSSLYRELNWIAFETSNFWFYFWFLVIMVVSVKCTAGYGTIIVEAGPRQLSAISFKVHLVTAKPSGDDDGLPEDDESLPERVIASGGDIKMFLASKATYRIQPEGLPDRFVKVVPWGVTRVRIPEDFDRVEPMVLVHPPIGEYYQFDGSIPNAPMTRGSYALELLVGRIDDRSNGSNRRELVRFKVPNYQGQAVLLGGNPDVVVPEFLVEHWKEISEASVDSITGHTDNRNRTLGALVAIKAFERNLVNLPLNGKSRLRVGDTVVARIFEIESNNGTVTTTPDFYIVSSDLLPEVCGEKYEEDTSTGLAAELKNKRRRYKWCGYTEIRNSNRYPVELKVGPYGEDWMRSYEWKPQ